MAAGGISSLFRCYGKIVPYRAGSHASCAADGEMRAMAVRMIASALTEEENTGLQLQPFQRNQRMKRPTPYRKERGVRDGSPRYFTPTFEFTLSAVPRWMLQPKWTVAIRQLRRDRRFAAHLLVKWTLDSKCIICRENAGGTEEASLAASGSPPQAIDLPKCNASGCGGSCLPTSECQRNR